MNIRIPQSGSAAKLALDYLTRQGVAVTHTQMLELVARLHGYQNLQAMKADEATKFADPHALTSESSTEYSLKDGQDHAWVTAGSISVRIAKKDEGVRVELFAIGAEDVAPSAQAELSFDDVPASAEDLERVCMQYEVATGEPREIARDLVKKLGFQPALDQMRNTNEMVIGLGPFVVRSVEAHGYWNEHQGWVYDKRSATGYEKHQVEAPSGLNPDAELVPYDTAVDFNPDDQPDGDRE